ncbi:MAG: UDP-N-acetylglucosamine 1-carboxyvinyltransferase [Oscillospiraceae bacterium]|jgi:UDP-N-acetylglucosamine 1-carboxyvinyltransferase|nr:UDP-N-acetylglucosamine 1-carboxyvinyltransferase [Oscillospiraceae bacterium]
MTKYVINGGKPLFGELEVSGAKNAAVAIIPAALLVDGPCRIENIPRISDVTMLLGILRQMGAKVNVVTKSSVDIDCSNINGTQATFDDMRRIRASYYLLGALLGRYGKASIAMPGGCNFGGVRPIDQHIKGFAAMGASVSIKNGIVSAETAGRAAGATIYFDIVSVGATINIILSSVLAEGRTVIENAAKEPHIVDLASFLNSMGADVRGAGTNVIKINGVRRLTGGSYSIIPDQIEAGTYMAAAAGAGGSVAVKNVIPKHLASISGKLREMGVEVFEGDDAVVVTREAPLRRTNVITLPYPGFPTDMQPQLSTVLCLAKGTSVVTEGVWDNRFKYVGELAKMGGNIQVGGRTAIIEGVAALTGAPLKSCDLRAGAAMVIAGLCAGGVTEIEGVEYIERGYEDIVGKLRGLGADIRSIYAPERSEFSMRGVG